MSRFLSRLLFYLFYSPVKIRQVPGTIRSVFRTSANTLRFVITIRDPVRRTISYFNHAVQNNWANLRRRKKREDLQFETWVKEELDLIQQCMEKKVLQVNKININTTFELYDDILIKSNEIKQLITTSDNDSDVFPWPHCGILGITTGLYVLQLKHWLLSFNPSQFMLVSFESIYSNQDNSEYSSNQAHR